MKRVTLVAQRRNQILSELADAVVGFNQDLTRAAARRALREGIEPIDAIMNGLVAGMERVSDLYEQGEYFMGETLLCKDCLYLGLEILRPHLQASPARPAQVVTATLQGDIHDIGKKIVVLLLQNGGFTVHDLGVDVPPEQVVEQALHLKADLVCLGAMQRATRQGVAIATARLRLSQPRIKIMLGGAAISALDADFWGADGYAADALTALELAMQLTNSQTTDQVLQTVIVSSQCGEDSRGTAIFHPATRQF